MRADLRRLGALAGPVYAELLSGVVAALISTFWVAGLGGAAVATVTLAASLENLLLGPVLVVGSGAALLTARAAGAGDAVAARGTARTAWRLCAGGSVLIAVPGALWRAELAGLFLDGPAVAAADGYLLVAFLGFPLFFAQKVADDLFKGTGDTRTPMRMALLSNALLLVLDPLLIRGPLGLTGAAVALVGSRAVALAVTAGLRFRAGGRARTQAAPVGPLLAAGAPLGVDFTARMAVGTAQLGLISSFGVAALAGYGVGYRVLLVATMAFYAVRQAAFIETGRRLGRGLPGDGLARSTALLAGAVGGAFAVLCAAAAVPLTRLFTSDPAVVAESVGFLRLMGLYLVPYALAVALGGVLQASGRGRVLVTATVLGLGVQLLAGYGLSRLLGVDGIWLAMTLSAVVQVAVMGSGRVLARSARAGDARVGGVGAGDHVVAGPAAVRGPAGPDDIGGVLQSFDGVQPPGLGGEPGVAARSVRLVLPDEPVRRGGGGAPGAPDL
ncbi:MATE family efflux transporter [Kitasatospora sp. NPDC004240]